MLMLMLMMAFGELPFDPKRKAILLVAGDKSAGVKSVSVGS